MNSLSNLCVFPSSSACPRLTRSATRRRRGRSRSKRSCGELPTRCPSTPARELEVCAPCVSHVAVDGVVLWLRALLLLSCSNSLLWPVPSHQARPVSSLLRLWHVRKAAAQSFFFFFLSCPTRQCSNPVARCVPSHAHTSFLHLPEWS